MASDSVHWINAQDLWRQQKWNVSAPPSAVVCLCPIMKEKHCLLLVCWKTNKIQVETAYFPLYQDNGLLLFEFPSVVSRFNYRNQLWVTPQNRRLIYLHLTNEAYRVNNVGNCKYSLGGNTVL